MRLAAAAVAFFLIAPCALADNAAPQRIQGTIVSFAAPVLTVAAGGKTHSVSLSKTARIIGNEKSALANIKVGDFLSTSAIVGKDGNLQAQEVRVFPEAMRGFGEGQYNAGKENSSLTNGTVAEVAATPKGTLLKLNFHGSTPGPNGICSGHAFAPGDGRCEGQTGVLVSAKAPVTNWVLGDIAWLEAGKAVSLYALAGRDGKLTTPGVIVEHNGAPPHP